jgi:hypothetical protein
VSEEVNDLILWADHVIRKAQMAKDAALNGDLPKARERLANAGHDVLNGLR